MLHIQLSAHCVSLLAPSSSATVKRLCLTLPGPRRRRYWIITRSGIAPCISTDFGSPTFTATVKRLRFTVTGPTRQRHWTISVSGIIAVSSRWHSCDGCLLRKAQPLLQFAVLPAASCSALKQLSAQVGVWGFCSSHHKRPRLTCCWSKDARVPCPSWGQL